jgi:PAS domain-containing protein
MKLNLPVTANEYVLADGQTLVSTTDLQSHITYCNAAFIAVSGYTREELLASRTTWCATRTCRPRRFATCGRACAAAARGRSW